MSAEIVAIRADFAAGRAELQPEFRAFKAQMQADSRMLRSWVAAAMIVQTMVSALVELL